MRNGFNRQAPDFKGAAFTAFPTIKPMLNAIVSLFFPPSCPVCGKEGGSGICPTCMKGIRPIQPPLCTLCGAPFVSAALAEHLCGGCMKSERSFSIARSAGLYEGTLLEAIHLLKYRGRTPLARPLASILAVTVDCAGYDIITPVPLHRKRLQERGFNQSLLLARYLAKVARLSLDYVNLRRIRATAPQTGLQGRERRGNVKGAFSVKNSAPFTGKRVLLVDDVYTTGATVTECSGVLKAAGAREVGVLTLARVADM